MTSEIRANTIKNRVGLGTVSFTNTGVVVSGIVTANSFSGPLNSTGDITSTGNITISNTTPTLTFTDTDANPDFQIKANTGHFYFVDATNNQTRFYVSPDGTTNFEGNLNANRDFSVERHTNLDNVSIAGVTTIANGGKLAIGSVVPSKMLELNSGGVVASMHESTGGNYVEAQFKNSVRHYILGLRPDQSNAFCLLDNTSGSGGVLLKASGHTVTLDHDLNVDGHTNLDNVSIAGVSTFSGVVRVPNGSAGAPAIHFGDSDSGVYGDASNGVRLTAGGSDTIVATTNGVTFPPSVKALTSLTLGSQSALSKPLYFADAASVQSASILLDNSSQELRIKNGRFSGILSFYTYNTEKLRIASDGQIKQTAASGDTIFTFKRSDTNTTGAVGVLNFAASDDHSVANIQVLGDGDNEGAHIVFKTTSAAASADPYNAATVERLRIDSSGRVLIGSTTNNTSSKVGDSALQVTTQDRKHPAIRIAAGNSNGLTMLADAYKSDESQVNIGVSYSSAKLVLSTSVKPSDTTDNEYLSSQDTFSARPTALTMNHQGILTFLNTDTNTTTTTDSAVSLTERFRIRADGTVRIGGDLYTDTAIMMTLKNRAGTGSQIQFHGTGTGNGNSDGLRVGYNGTGGQMWLFENGGYLRFATSNNERVRIDEYGAITHTRGDNTTRWDVEFRQTGGISNGNYGGIKWTQNSTGGVHLSGIKLAYSDTGRPDLVFSQRNRGGGTGEQETFRIDRDGEHIKTRASTRYENSQVRTIEFPLYLSSGTTHTILTLGGSFDTGFVCFAVLEYIGLYAYAGNSMSGGVRRAYTRRTYNNTQWRDFDDQVSENYGENYRPTLYWENGVLKCTVGGSVQITGFIKICGHGNNINNVQFTRNQGL